VKESEQATAAPLPNRGAQSAQARNGYVRRQEQVLKPANGAVPPAHLSAQHIRGVARHGGGGEYYENQKKFGSEKK
jgi:hypothetical protein